MSILYRPFDYVLADGSKLKRKLKDMGRKIVPENGKGIVAEAYWGPRRKGQRILTVKMNIENNNQEAILAMLSLDLLTQLRQSRAAAPFFMI